MQVFRNSEKGSIFLDKSNANTNAGGSAIPLPVIPYKQANKQLLTRDISKLCIFHAQTDIPSVLVSSI